MPASFTDRERARHVYSRRFVPVEIPNEPSEILEDNVPVVVIDEEPVKAAELEIPNEELEPTLEDAAVTPETELVGLPDMGSIPAATMITPSIPPLVRMASIAPIRK